jgi:hypothetical protein
MVLARLEEILVDVPLGDIQDGLVIGLLDQKCVAGLGQTVAIVENPDRVRKARDVDPIFGVPRPR